MRWPGANIIIFGLILVLGFLVIYPLAMIFYGSFQGGGPGTATQFSVEGYEHAFSNVGTYKTLWTTFWLSAVRTALTMVLALFLAWVVTRTDTPWRGGLEFLVWLVFLGLPLLPTVVAWTLLAGPRGFLNLGLMALFPLSEPPLNIYSYWGIIWVSSTFWASIVFILVTPAFRNMDASLEESSRMSGASGFTTLRRITVPVLAPAILGATFLVFIRLMESFEIELILGYSARIFVYTTRIWWLMGVEPADIPQAMALSSLFLFFVFGLIVWQWQLLGQRQYVTIAGRGFTVRPTRLGRWRYVTFGVVIFYFVVTFILPFLTLILGSFMKVWGVWMKDPLTTQNWFSAVGDPRFLKALRNTLFVAFGAATSGMVLYSLISYIVVRTGFAGRKLLDFISWLPWGVPSLIMSLGFLWAYVGGVPFLSPLFGTLWLLMLVFVVRGLPLGCRVMNGAMHQVGKEIEESSRVLGASWAYTFRRVLAPLVSPAFVSAWIILFLLAVRDVVTVIFLYTSSSRMISVLLLEQWIGGEYERATALGLVMALLVAAGALLARFLGSRQQIAA